MIEILLGLGVLFIFLSGIFIGIPMLVLWVMERAGRKAFNGMTLDEWWRNK